MEDPEGAPFCGNVRLVAVNLGPWAEAVLSVGAPAEWRIASGEEHGDDPHITGVMSHRY
jgi:hypothetical protein